MKHLSIYACVLASVLPLSAAERIESANWQWIKTSAILGKWDVRTGDATVSISNGIITAQLREKGDSKDLFTLSGTIRIGQLGQEMRGVQPGEVAVIVTPIDSGMNPAKYEGTYRKIVFDSDTARKFGVRSQEIIIINDTFNSIGLFRETK